MESPFQPFLDTCSPPAPLEDAFARCGGSAGIQLPQCILGHRIQKVLRCGDASGTSCEKTADSLSLLVEKAGVSYVMKLLPAGSRTIGSLSFLLNLRRLHLCPLTDLWVKDGIIICTRKFYPEVPTALTVERIAERVEAVLALTSSLGGVLNGNINTAPSNIMEENGTVVLVDWFVPYLSAQQATFRDRERLCEWLFDALRGTQYPLDVQFPPPPPAPLGEVGSNLGDLTQGSLENGSPQEDGVASHPAAFADFASRLMHTTEDLVRHEWLLSARETSASPFSRLAAMRKICVAPHNFVSTNTEKERLILNALLPHVYNGIPTDKYASGACFKRLNGFAKEHRNGAITHDTLASLGKKFRDNIVPPLQMAEPEKVEAVWYCSEGDRNEDACCSIMNLSAYSGVRDGTQDYACGVFDGHGGAEASQYSNHQLLPEIRNSPYYASDMEKACISAFETVNRNFIHTAESLGVDSGTTATVVIIRDGTLHCASVGDSSAVLCRGTTAIRLSKEHRASDPTERSLVESRGGCVMKVMGTDRVEGRLCVTRAVGDPSVAKVISCLPCYNSEVLQAEDEFVIVASDGLWDVMTPEEVVENVLQCKAEIDGCASMASPSAQVPFAKSTVFEEPEGELLSPISADSPRSEGVGGGGGDFHFGSHGTLATVAAPKDCVVPLRERSKVSALEERQLLSPYGKCLQAWCSGYEFDTPKSTSSVGSLYVNLFF